MSAPPAARIPALVSDTPPDRVRFWPAVWQAQKEFRSHQLLDNAAALTYYAVMSLFPSLLLAVSLVGLVASPTVAIDASDYILRKGASGSTADTVRQALETLTESKASGAVPALVISLVLALNGASGAFAAAGRALNKVYAVDERRGFFSRKLTDLGWTLLVLVLLSIVVGAIFLGGDIADDLLGTIGLGESGKTAWSVARWPLALLAIIAVFAIVYSYAPSLEARRRRWLTPGAVTAVLVWALTSVLLSIYFKNFASYGATYGAASVIIVLMLWLYVTAIAFLFGAELNVVLDRRRAGGQRG